MKHPILVAVGATVGVAAGAWYALQKIPVEKAPPWLLKVMAKVNNPISSVQKLYPSSEPVATSPVSPMASASEQHIDPTVEEFMGTK